MPDAQQNDPPVSFFREFLRDPRATAAVAPSSQALARRMVAGIDFARVTSIVEYGPGGGVFTRALIEVMPRGWHVSEGGRGKFIAIEFNPRLAEKLASLARVEIVTESAANVEKICAERGIAPGGLDHIISGLGWTAFPPALCTDILGATGRVLRHGGELRTFAYHVGAVMPGFWHFRREARRLIGSCGTAYGAWRNIPPAFIYRCIKK